jgi:hypothetical protein
MLKTAKYVTDRDGKRIAVQISIKEFEQILEELEDMEDVRAANAAKASGGKAIPIEQAMSEIRRRRK